MRDDDLPPGVTRGPYRGQRRPTTSLWLVPSIGILTGVVMAVSQWLRGGGIVAMWTSVAIVVLGLLSLRAGLRQLRRDRTASDAVGVER